MSNTWKRWWLTSVAALAIATAALADGDAPTDIYIIGVDSLTTLTSGTYAGLPNPNYGRLTFLYAHYTPGTEHFHSIGAWSYSGSRDNPVVRNTSNNNRIPELAQRDRQTGQRYLYLRPVATACSQASGLAGRTAASIATSRCARSITCSASRATSASIA